MKKRKVLSGLVPGSAEYVIAHARWQRLIGKRPTVPYRGISNPNIALIRAWVDLYGDGISLEIIEGKLRHIVSTSWSKSEIRKQIVSKLGYSGPVEITWTRGSGVRLANGRYVNITILTPLSGQKIQV